MRFLPISALVCAASSALLACAAPTPRPVALNDGDIPLPADYRSWPKFLTSVQRPDAKQVRDIYINQAGTTNRSGQPFAQGTVFVMENFAAQVDAAGAPRTGADGKLVKGDLVRVFVMAKGPGYGTNVPAELKTGDWAFASYDGKGAKAADNLNGCRGCHVPLASADFVFRVDEFHAVRSKGGY
jgi:hemoglobin